MSAALGCPYIAGPACRDCDGACWEQPEPERPAPTCADYGHPPAAEDEDGTTYCHCGDFIACPAQPVEGERHG